MSPSVSFPVRVCSATSSNGFILSKNSSTPVAVSVSNPKSISSAPKETKPSGIFKAPDAIPAKKDLKKPGDLSSFASSSSFKKLFI